MKQLCKTLKTMEFSMVASLSLSMGCKPYVLFFFLSHGVISPRFLWAPQGVTLLYVTNPSAPKSLGWKWLRKSEWSFPKSYESGEFLTLWGKSFTKTFLFLCRERPGLCRKLLLKASAVLACVALYLQGKRGLRCRVCFNFVQMCAKRTWCAYLLHLCYFLTLSKMDEITY